MAASTSMMTTPRLPSAEWYDLEVGDVDAELGGEREDLGRPPGTVRDRDAHLGQVGGAGDPARQVGARRAGPRRAGRAARRGRRRPRRRASRRGRRSGRRARRRSRRGSRRRCPARSRDGPTRCGSCRGSRRRPGAAARRAPRPGRRPAPISVAAARWGTWLTRRRRALSWRSGGEGHDLGAERRTRPTRPWRTRCRAVSGVGVSTHTAPSNSSGSAPSSPSCSQPAIGWPPTKRGSSTAATTGALTLPTSVTKPVRSRRAHACTASAIGEHGRRDERDRRATGSSPTASIAPRSRASASVAAFTSDPMHAPAPLRAVPCPMDAADQAERR